MTDPVNILKDKIKSELVALNASDNDLEWIYKEYSRYMIVSAEDYFDCLYEFVEENNTAGFTPIAKMLMGYSDEYEYSKAVFLAAKELWQ